MVYIRKYIEYAMNVNVFVLAIVIETSINATFQEFMNCRASVYTGINKIMCKLAMSSCLQQIYKK